MRIRLNDTEHETSWAPGATLLQVLPDELGLTGTKYGCGEGSCGACTVLLNWEPKLACQLTADDVEGRSITTIEGLARKGRLHPVQRAFADLGAMQCGYCTPGMMLATTALIARNAEPKEADVREAPTDNVCRCCAYPRILRAAGRAAELARSPDGWSRDGRPVFLPRLPGANVGVKSGLSAHTLT
jgi:aerobic-type carbon monoxide dehydrogenase small subunit (CoxS/CutS family)